MTNKKPAKKAAKKAPAQKAPAKKIAKKAPAKKPPAKKVAKKAPAKKPSNPEETPTEASPRPVTEYLTRPADMEDVPALVAIGNELGFFNPEDVDEAVELLTKYFSGKLARHAWLVAEVDATVVGSAYFLPEPGTFGTWNLRFLGVDGRHRNRGGGQALLAKVEETLRMTKGRIIVETAGTDDLQVTRDFLAKNGYLEAARIQDFIDSGVDKIIHIKAL